MSGSATKGTLGKTVFGHDENGGREAISGGGKLQQDRFTIEFDLAKAKPMPRTSVDAGACMFHTVLRSVARLSMSAVLPHDVEAVLCKLYSHYTYAAVHTKISTNTPTKAIKRTETLEYKSWYTSIDAYTCVHNLKEFRVQKFRNQCRDKRGNTFLKTM